MLWLGTLVAFSNYKIRYATSVAWPAIINLDLSKKLTIIAAHQSGLLIIHPDKFTPWPRDVACADAQVNDSVCVVLAA